ncbi:MAG TPA: DNA gyrase subunit A [Candidatus Dormibacteraeota bacterium]|nr:DNA gyrase subunit A [Candidatus Dormibacteraeota bacterium]
MADDETQEPRNIGVVNDADIETEMRASYMDYAMSVIISRALPDVRDGLKPVQRRILYAMYDQGMTPGARFSKSAAVVGEVMKHYHPHGDASIYDTMVRLAQPWNMRYPLVQGQGNFGSQDGDSAAAQRYTEAKLASAAMQLLDDLEKETVDWIPNYSATVTEPSILPTTIPNLLVNGSSGIAVGMTTNIPPHNLNEVCDGLTALIDNPELTTEDLLGYIKGPDFPTGGVIVGSEGIKNAYGTGHGRIIVRGRYVIEESRQGYQQIVVEEVPYQVNKSALVAKIAELVGEKKLEGIRDLRDESDRNGMRIVIELKKDANPNTVVANLFKHTALQSTFGAIMLAVVDGRPQTLNLKQLLQNHIEYRRDVITRRTRYELTRAQERAHILEGLKICIDNIDTVIRIIRAAGDEAEAQHNLETQLKLSERQSKAIVDMRLGRLTKLEAGKVEAEYKEVIERIAYLEDILGNPRKVMQLIKDDLVDLKKKFGDERRTTIAWDASTDLDMESLIPTEDVVVTLTDKGYIKRVPATTYKPQKRGGKGLLGAKFREEDYVKHLVVASTKSDMLFFTDSGRVFRIRTHEVPDASRQSKGIPVVNLIDIEPRDTITSVVAIREWSDDHYLFSATRDGMIKKTPAIEYRSVMRNGKIAMALRDDDRLRWVAQTSGSDEILFATTDGKAVRFSETEVRPMGRDTMGVKGLTLRQGAHAAGMEIVKPDVFVLVVSENGYGKLTPIDEYPTHHRGGQGVYTLQVTPKTGELVGIRVVEDRGEELMVISTKGQVIRTDLSEVRIAGRQTQGVIIMRLADGDTVGSIAGVGDREEVEEEG